MIIPRQCFTAQETMLLSEHFDFKVERTPYPRVFKKSVTSGRIPISAFITVAGSTRKYRVYTEGNADLWIEREGVRYHLSHDELYEYSNP